MTMWIVSFRHDGDTSAYREYYTNEEAAKTRAKYFEDRFFRVYVEKKEILDKPREGAPEGWAMWDGQAVK